jgi:hypothetical protein
MNKQPPNEDDLIRLCIKVAKNNGFIDDIVFGVVRKTLKLKDDDSNILQRLKGK